MYGCMLQDRLPVQILIRLIYSRGLPAELSLTVHTLSTLYDFTKNKC